MIDIRKAVDTVWPQIWGFEIIGTLPKALNHRTKGLVDAHIMYQLLI
jgi:hypothetical protein